MYTDDKTINANPTKRFFIEMLVRDIALEPAIAELVDNSLDGARKIREVYDNDCACDIKVSFDDKKFEIIDSCGGISISDAKNYCFRFGRDTQRTFDVKEGTGVFGIGMKRALFRMGKVFDIESVTPAERFKIHIDVDEWIKDDNPDWTFLFDEIETGLNNDISSCGTSITVTRLHEGIKNSFINPFFRKTFFNYVQMRSSMIQQLKVNIIVNEQNVQYADEKILFSDKFRPYVKILDIDGVRMKIIAGCARTGEPKKAGWYVQCNGRTVLFANQGEETGWGTDGVRRFHVAFAAFRGYVEFVSDNLEKLPWNTTKTGVDLSSKYYQIALEKMKDCTKLFISWRDKVDDFIKDNPENEIKISDIFKGSEIGMLSDDLVEYTKTDNAYKFPELNAVDFPVPPEPVSSITFKELKSKVDEVKVYLGNARMTNKEMGEKIFDYFYEREID